MKKFLLLKITVVLVLYSILVNAQTAIFEAEGSGLIQGVDVGKARKDAVKNALSRAVESASASILPASVFENNYDVLDQHILRNPEAYVTNQVILSETRDAQRYRVTVRVSVNMDKLRSELIRGGLLLPKEKIPLWLVIIPERVGNEEWHSKWYEGGKGQSYAESALENAITEYGFRTVAKSPQSKLLPMNEIENTVKAVEKIVNGGNEIPPSLIKYAGSTGAGYLVVGRVQTTLGEGMSGAGFKLAIADIELVAVEVSTREIIASFAVRPAMESPQEEGLVGKNIKLGISKIKLDFYKTLDSVNPASSPAGFPEIMLSLEGATSFDQYVAIRDFLENRVRGVRSVEIVKISPTQIVLKIKFTGKSETLVSTLMANKFSDFKLEDGGENGGIRKIIIKGE